MAGPSESRELHGRHTAGMLSQSPAFIERVTWTPTRLHDEREEALRRLLRVAIDKSPWHAHRLKGVDPARFRVGDLTALPPMTKADLMDHSTRSSSTTDTPGRCWTGISPRSPPTPTYWAATTESHRGDPVVNGECSSTTGMPGVSFYLSLQRFFLRDGHQDPSLEGVARRVVVVAASRASHMSSALGQTFSSPDTEICNFPVTLPLERIVAGLNQWQPTVLQGYASMLHQLAVEARRGHAALSPRRIRSRSEPLLPEIRSDLETTWGSPSTTTGRAPRARPPPPADRAPVCTSART